MYCLNTILFLQIKIQNNYKSQLARLPTSGLYEEYKATIYRDCFVHIHF